MSALEAISGMVMIAGGMLLAALILLAASGILWLIGHLTWRRAKNLYRLERMLWAFRDMETHGVVLRRSDMDEKP